MSIYSLVSFLSFAIYAALIYVLHRHKPRRVVHKTFMFYLLGVTLWAGFAFLLYVFPQSNVLLSNLMLVSALYTVVAYFHFLRAFINKPGGMGVILGYAAIAALIPLIAQSHISYVIKRSAGFSSGPQIEFTFIGVGVIALGCLFLVGWAILGLIQKYRMSTDPLERNRIIYLLLGFTAMALFGLTKVHPVLTKYPLAHVGNLVNAIAITFAIVRYQLLDVNLVLRRGLVYVSTGIGAVGLYLALLFGLLYPLNLKASYATLVIGAGAAFLIATLFHPARHFVQKGLERLIFKETYDYRHLLLTFANKMSHVLDMDELAEYMLTLITKGLHTKEVSLFLADDNDLDFYPKYTLPPEGNRSSGLQLAKDSPLLTWLAKEGIPLSREQINILPQMKSLWQKEKDNLRESQVELFFPILNKGNLIGVLALGKKGHNGPYRSEEMDLVMTMTSQAGVVIENAQLYAAAKMRANTDELTGLYNHRYFHERLEEEISRGLRFGSIFSLVFLDLDFFKRYNDTHGHLAGDEILRQVGHSLKNSLRNTDMAFRYGGDEFSVILPATSGPNAYKVAERIRKSVEEGISSKDLLMTCSVGVATWPTDGMMRDALIQSADSTLYHAKRWGSRTCLASELAPPSINPPEAGSATKQGLLSTIYALAATVDARDHHTYGHSRRVSNYAVAIGEAIGLPPEKIAILHTAALLHDIGKIGISDEVLNKKDHLTDEEWKPVYSHPTLGVSILRHTDGLSPCLPGIQYHHEHYDGGGYPSGLKGNNIPLDARIISIADAYEAMTSPRPYRERTLAYEEALEELESNKGTQFDPELVTVFVELMKRNAPTEVEVA